ncbi:hypothetical protein ACIOK4_40010 [Streptomyces bottropensis]|uniref:hypothetical protein n=1 Tax=Streptomyces bottropensis TaxID=42235 RepID=UPI0038236CCE
MSRPSIAQADEQIGFHWVSEAGTPISLPDLLRVDDEPQRLVPTHLSALDDALIDAVNRFGEFLGGGCPVGSAEDARNLRTLHRTLDRLCHEYAAALAPAGLTVERRGGQIIGTAQLVAARARMALGTAGPSPLAGELDEPSVGVVAGRGQMCVVDETQPWRGSRWIVQSEDGHRYPLTLSMLLFDSSGVLKDAALDEHREALRAVTAAAVDEDADPDVAAGAIDWLLHDWLMAHRESPESAAIEIRRTDDAEMIVAAAAAGARVRAAVDIGLFEPVSTN